MEYYTHVGWVSVIVGAVLSFLLGWLWYSPKLFGVKWAEGSGVKMDSAGKMPAEAMATQGIGLLMMSWFINVAGGNAGLRALIAFGVLAYSGHSFIGKSHYAKLVDAGYWIASFAVMMLVRKVLGGM
jgi:Protein of unknown function (DUF1761)